MCGHSGPVTLLWVVNYWQDGTNTSCDVKELRWRSIDGSYYAAFPCSRHYSRTLTNVWPVRRTRYRLYFRHDWGLLLCYPVLSAMIPGIIPGVPRREGTMTAICRRSPPILSCLFEECLGMPGNVIYRLSSEFLTLILTSCFDSARHFSQNGCKHYLPSGNRRVLLLITKASANVVFI